MLKLRGAFTNNPRVGPLLDGSIQPRDCEITWEAGDMGEMAVRHMRENAFDVFEFSISDYFVISQRTDARWDWIGLPVFQSKAMLQLNTWVHVKSGIESSADLKGKSLAVGDYTMTAFLWFRAMVDQLHGVKPQDISWVNCRVGEHSHSTLLGLQNSVPPGVSIQFLERIAMADELFQTGKIDAACATAVPLNTGSANVRPLFPDGGHAFVRDFRQAAGFVGCNHTLLMQRRLAKEHPWLPEALYEAFERSKQEAYRRDPTARLVFPKADAGWQADAFGSDPYAPGLAANRAMITMGAQQSLKDGLVTRVPDVDSLWCESLRGT